MTADPMRKQVLVVDDSGAMRSMISAVIQSRLQADITECASGLEAIKILPHHDFDLILTDINMPDINGLELIQFLRSNEKFTEIPLIVVSTESSARDRQKGLALGADAYVTKPFEPEQLAQVVVKLTDSN